MRLKARRDRGRSFKFRDAETGKPVKSSEVKSLDKVEILAPNTWNANTIRSLEKYLPEHNLVIQRFDK